MLKRACTFIRYIVRSYTYVAKIFLQSATRLPCAGCDTQHQPTTDQQIWIIERQRQHMMKPSTSPFPLLIALFLFAFDNKYGCLPSRHFADALLFTPPVGHSHCSHNKWRGRSACGGVVSVKKRYGVLQMSVQPVSFLQSCF